MKIYSYDITGGWSTDEYNAQRGHIVRLFTDIDKKSINKIVWDLNGEIVNGKHIVDYIFQKTYENSDNTISHVPAEGFVTIKCMIVHKCGKEVNETKKLLISPVIDCEIFYESYSPIKNNTKYIDLVGAVQCMPLNMGDPFKGNDTFACGGACWQDCPRFEIKMSKLRGTRISKYGKHCITAQPTLYGGEANDTCIDLYKKDIIGKESKYPPIKSIVTIVPRHDEIKIVINRTNNHCSGCNKKKCCSNKKNDRLLAICGVSNYMLPCGAKFVWHIKYEKDDYIVKVTSEQSNVFYCFNHRGEYSVKCIIHIPECNPVETEAKIIINEYCDDILIHPFSKNSYLTESSIIEVGEIPEIPIHEYSDDESESNPIPVPVQ